MIMFQLLFLILNKIVQIGDILQLFKQKSQLPLFDFQFACNKIRSSFSEFQLQMAHCYFSFNYEVFKYRLIFLFTLHLITNDYQPKIIKIKNLQTLKKIKIFAYIQPLKSHMSTEQLAKLSKNIKKQLTNSFCNLFSIFFDHQVNQLNSLNNICQNLLIIKQEDQAKQWLKQLFHDDIFGGAICKMSSKLNLNNNFIKNEKIRRLQENLQYPTNEECEIQQILVTQCQKNNSQMLPATPIKQYLILPIYPLASIASIQLTNYKQIFRNIYYSYQVIGNTKKLKILTYVKQINEQYKQYSPPSATLIDKYHALKDIICKRSQFLIQLKPKVMDNQAVQTFIYDLIDNQQGLSNIAKRYEEKKIQGKGIEEFYQEEFQKKASKKVKID